LIAYKMPRQAPKLNPEQKIRLAAVVSATPKCLTIV
jgi:hypothetical protein